MYNVVQAYHSYKVSQILNYCYLTNLIWVEKYQIWSICLNMGLRFSIITQPSLSLLDEFFYCQNQASQKFQSDMITKQCQYEDAASRDIIL